MVSNSSIIEILQDDITKIRVDAIVNPANTSLLGGSGLDGAIHRIGGSAILEECKKIRNKQGGCKVGEAVITTAGKLPSKYIIHAVGPVWNDMKSNEDKLLSLVYLHCLELCIENQIQTIAFPNISTGIYRFPKQLAAEIAFKTVKDFLVTTDKIEKVIFVCYDNENYDLYTKLIKKDNLIS